MSPLKCILYSQLQIAKLSSRGHLERWEQGSFRLVAVCLLSKFLHCTRLLQHPVPTVLQGQQHQLFLATTSDDFSMEGLPWDTSFWTDFLGRVFSSKFHQHCTTVTSLPSSEPTTPPPTSLGLMLEGLGSSLCTLPQPWGQWLFLISAILDS